LGAIHKFFAWESRQQYQRGAGEKIICAMPRYRKDTIHLIQADDVAPCIVSSPVNKHEELALTQF
jgi:hypothetical protein